MRQVAFIDGNQHADVGGFGGEQGALQQHFAGRGHGGGYDDQQGNVGGNQFRAVGVLPVEQALARQQLFDNRLLAVERGNAHPIAAGEINPFAARIGFVKAA